MTDNHNTKEDDNINEPHIFYKEEIKKQNKTSKFLKRFFIYLGSVAFSLTLGIVLSFSYMFLKNIIIPNYANSSIIEASKIEAIAKPVSIIENSNDLVKSIIENVKSSVLSITTLTNDVDWFMRPVQYEGVGSGIVFHKTLSDIFIATNYHVIANASSIGVAIDDNKPVQANLVGKDENSDLAVLSISTDALSKEELNKVRVATFTDSSNVMVGDYVIAMGNALGEGITSTFGIISSTSTDILSNRRQLNVLQTTAAINPGNSGGALINLKGEVIGINTSKVADNKIENIGYTIGSSVAMPIIENIMNDLNPTSLGVTVTDVSNANINSEDIAGGAIIVEIVEGGSAHKAGLKSGDIITSINDIPILSSSQLVEEVKKYKVSDTIKLKFIRNGELKTIRVKFLPNIK